jgi:hypothetical protein
VRGEKVFVAISGMLCRLRRIGPPEDHVTTRLPEIATVTTNW